MSRILVAVNTLSTRLLVNDSQATVNRQFFFDTHYVSNIHTRWIELVIGISGDIFFCFPLKSCVW